MNDIDVGDVRVFERAATLGALASAARALHVGRSTATRQLLRLEEAVGCRLIDRDARNFVLTQEGRAFLPYATRLLESVGDAVAAVRPSDGPLRGRIHVSSPMSFAMRALVPHLAEFLASHPQLQVILDLNSASRLIADEIDIAFRPGPIEAHSLVSRKIAEKEIVLVAAPHYLDVHGRPSDPSELTTHAFLDARAEEGDGEVRLLGADGPVRVRCRSAVRTNDAYPLVALAEQGCGIARLPRALAEEALAAGRLELVLPAFPHEARTMYALYSPGRVGDPRVRAFLDFIVEVGRRGAPASVRTLPAARAPQRPLQRSA